MDSYTAASTLNHARMRVGGIDRMNRTWTLDEVGVDELLLF